MRESAPALVIVIEIDIYHLSINHFQRNVCLPLYRKVRNIGSP